MTRSHSIPDRKPAARAGKIPEQASLPIPVSFLASFVIELVPAYLPKSAEDLVPFIGDPALNPVPPEAYKDIVPVDWIEPVLFDTMTRIYAWGAVPVGDSSGKDPKLIA